MQKTCAFSIALLGLLALVACTAPTTREVNSSVGASGAGQDMQVDFWLKGGANNLTGCIAFDPQFTRKHVFTLKNGQAEIHAPGGLNTSLGLVRPGIYQTRLQLGRLNMLVTADVLSKPKTLTVQDS